MHRLATLFPSLSSLPSVALSLMLLLPLSASAQTDCAVQTQIPQSECEALVAIYQAFDGPNWVRSRPGWLQTNQPCNWFGVDCAAGQVTRLSLNGGDLVGSLPAALGDLPALRWLILVAPNLEGPIPVEIGTLSDLIFLQLADVQINGPLPPEIGNLTLLEELSITNSGLTGTIPPEIGNLTLLERLFLTNNELSGAVPPEIGNLVNLRVLGIGNTRVTSLPPEIGNLQQAIFVRFDNNALTSVPWPELGSLSSLVILGLSGNDLAGGFPLDLVSLPEIEEVWLSSNHFSGPLPPELADFNFTLRALILEENQFSGSIPSELATMNAVVQLRDNDLSGEVPAEFGTTFNSIVLHIQENCVMASDPAVRAYLDQVSPGWEETQCLKIFEDGFQTGDLSRWSGVAAGNASSP